MVAYKRRLERILFPKANMADEENQEDELLALTSIYDDRIFSQSSEERGGQFNVFLDLPRPFYLKIHTRNFPAYSKARRRDRTHEGVGEAGRLEENIELLEMQYLPPIVLNFRFPHDYPSKSPPLFTLSCKWLTVVQLSKLCKCLDEIWSKEGCGEVILFRWIQFLLDETLTTLSIESPFPLHFKRIYAANNKRIRSDQRAFQDVASYSKLVGAVVEYEQQEKIRVFSSSYFNCNVCFSEKPGSSCLEFHDCGHVFCAECMAGYFKVQIEDGAVQALNCPMNKCESQALPSQVKKLVSPELFAKYDQFLLQHSLDGMSDISYCPRPSCRTPVMLEKESLMGVCSSCSFAFCSFCKHSYHGVSPCAIRDLKKLQAEYNLASSEEREVLEKRFGKVKLQRMLEEMISEEWLDSNAKYCPNCKTWIQKFDGCNKMTCSKCRVYFCWLCMEVLSRSNPYQHFNGPGSKCFNRLFEGIDAGDDDDDDWWF